jgi:hypothetical protein
VEEEDKDGGRSEPEHRRIRLPHLARRREPVDYERRDVVGAVTLAGRTSHCATAEAR